MTISGIPASFRGLETLNLNRQLPPCHGPLLRCQRALGRTLWTTTLIPLRRAGPGS